MSRRLKPTLADYVVLAINPVLIMGLVGSLIYFLLELLYGGQYPDRLQFCLTMFVFAIVLISRISMEDGFERAAPFGIALAVVVGIALNRFVDYHGASAETYAWAINWSLMALTWWCAHKLTWDCTSIDESAAASGRGLLETAGIDRSSDDPADTPTPARVQTATAPPANLPPPTELSQKKWQQLLDRPNRPHTPGVWVVYFSLASLPIFGLGQRFIPAANTASRRYVFLLLCVYVECGLALLLTTSFLSLRRYLRTRRLEMPAAMAGNWLVIGGVMVVALLLFSALLPRPAPEYEISALPGQSDSGEESASPVSAGSEGVRDPEAGSDSGIDHSPNQSADASPDQPDQSPGADTRQISTGQNGNSAGKSGSPASKTTSGDQGENSSAGKSGQQSDEKPQPQANDDQSSDSQSSEKPKSDPPAGSENAPPQSAEKPPGEPPSEPKSSAEPKPPGEQEQPASPPPSPAANSPPPPLPALGAMFGSLSGMLKMAFYAALICGVAYGAWRSRAELWEIVAGWLAALRAFWRSFFVDPDEPPRSAEEIALDQQQLGWSFSDFVDPFASGAAQNSPPAELVKYTFAALEAWGREQGFPRDSDATPHEFVAVLGSKIPVLRADSLALANLYSRAVYSRASLSTAAIQNLSQLWRLMQSARPEQPAMPQ